MSTDLAVLCEDPEFQQDVWITESESFRAHPPDWLVNSNIKMAIRALLKKKRCLEEQRRIQRELLNMLKWFGIELCAIETALSLAKGGR